MDYRSSYAVDKNGNDQAVSGTDSTLIVANRVLWDLNSDFYMDTSEFVAPLDGIWTGNGTIKIADVTNRTKISLEIWRNGEIWFTVMERLVLMAETSLAMVYACDMDCYYSSNHRFDLRLRLEGNSPSCTISGSEDDTAWGATFRYSLSQASPT